jgi:hypothetical protein
MARKCYPPAHTAAAEGVRGETHTRGEARPFDNADCGTRTAVPPIPHHLKMRFSIMQKA